MSDLAAILQGQCCVPGLNGDHGKSRPLLRVGPQLRSCAFSIVRMSERMLEDMLEEMSLEDMS